ncbi:class I SAM-dependent RNA methyltransferase [Corynebacterium mendelii]|uniref:Class I SAM-dependent RNA methyltransferase n=1 Tax=Corynebacterium mendelii TaxID=2765362 RepID=A0A939E004_9CORY|nr:TRAM domain-containing protein [Corynebacterium mendelii]MBN9643353.1 class I SAM-dependent RNA methyltransferase [Corynebacterium mendelii]
MTQPDPTNPRLAAGDTATVTITRPCHGGGGIGELPDGRVVMVADALPGDVAEVRVTRSKKSFALAEIVSLTPSDIRVPQRCPAAAAGAGCCDFGHVDPDAAPELKKDVVTDQLRRIGRLDVGKTPPAGGITVATAKPYQGWRTRVRLGVDDEGRAGLRAAKSNRIITSRCAQTVPGLTDGIIGDDAARFTPGMEVVAVIDGLGRRHVVEVPRPGRGKRATASKATVIEGTGEVTETLGELAWRLPATAFWQAHTAAPGLLAEAISRLTAEGLRVVDPTLTDDRSAGWDLYGGAGVFAPALGEALEEAVGEDVTVYSVEASAAAAASGRQALADIPVTFVTGDVAAAVAQLPAPLGVVCDPPRTGAGEKAIAACAAAAPPVVVHLGCDAATFARDTGSWMAHGYRLHRLEIIDTFPGTHHVESIGLFVRN